MQKCDFAGVTGWGWPPVTRRATDGPADGYAPAMRRRGWSRSPQGDGLVDVELVDVPTGSAVTEHEALTGPAPPPVDGQVVDAVPDAGAAPPPAPRHRPGRRPVRWWAGLVVVVVLAVVVVGANVAEARRTDARRAALATTPGFVPSLAEPLRETWRVAGSVRGQSRDTLLFATADGVQAIDAATGDVRWTRPGDGLDYCPTVGVPLDLLTGMPLDEPDETGVLPPQLFACPAAGTATGGSDFGTVAVEVIDALTGQVRTTLTASGALFGTIPFDSDVVMVLTTAEGRLRLVRWDPATGDTLFDETTAEAIVPAGTAPDGGYQYDQDTLTILAGRPVAFSLATGLELPDTAASADGWTARIPMADGAEVTWTYSQSGSGHGQVVDADGTVRFDLDKRPWWNPTTDGSVPEVMVVVDETNARTAMGLDARTGTELWTAGTPDGQPLVQVDGVLVVLAPTVSFAVDVRDGSTLWSVPA